MQPATLLEAAFPSCNWQTEQMLLNTPGAQHVHASLVMLACFIQGLQVPVRNCLLMACAVQGDTTLRPAFHPERGQAFLLP